MVESAPRLTADQILIAAPVETYMAALNNQDMQALMGVFTADAVVMPNESPTVTGHKELEVEYSRRFAVFAYQRELHIDDCRSEGNLAVLRCHTTGSLTLRAKQQKFQATARESFTLVREDQKWLICAYMFNFPAAMAN